ncbi:hypothetical protein [uncultured Sanguibacteroides sp.]|uniref:hypothetical protein n=1 Tax=uncultured Sanguibacteroides sp. TaxID=1635151 RepID=UPI0025F26A8E|nr:hypothetical protein [uncultured Sanguibacteroides sp.]
MRRYLTGIFLSVIFVLGFSGIKDVAAQMSQAEVSVKSSNTRTDTNSVGSIDSENKIALANEYIFDAFYLRSCDMPVAASSVPRVLNFSKNLRSSTIQILSSLSTPLLARDSKNLYFHYCFVKFSYRYFIYTLRRIRI